MRFVYGFILGVLASVISAILYLAFAGGEYLLQLSPHYHEMVSTIASLKEAREQRDQLSARLDALADGFDQLTRRFNELQDAASEPSHRGAALPSEAASAAPEGTPAGTPSQPGPPPHPKPRPEPTPAAPAP
jgi:uncharacterized phage infection (PIP) family protein YhgE